MSAERTNIVFVTTLDGSPWGGSEVLWSETAMHLHRAGHVVGVSVCRWPQRARVVQELVNTGVNLNERAYTWPWLRPRFLQGVAAPFVRRRSLRGFQDWLRRMKPALICISQGSIVDDFWFISWLPQSGWKYATLLHANAECIWPNDTRASQVLDLYQGAARTYFVSNGNRALLETQLGVDMPRAEVVRNPFNVRRDAAPPWPADTGTVRLACVGRLEPDAKGQDLLLQVLARENWRSRPVSVSFYGSGDKAEGLRRLVQRLRLTDRVQFCGHTDDIEGLWATHHALILPSRFEGLPITIVEAMHCGRPVIVTDVAGNCEVVQDGVTGFVAESPTVRHLDAAMERAWSLRSNWQAIGVAAAKSIREIMPPNAAEVFAAKLLRLADTVQAGK
ncbi:MAG TPA: glycosyltransferase family 4 protein [Verrucomicrobiota bacterium]|nr:glycosyltransferase family 4 protein [Verrucomicrobiota bacterium]